MQLQNQLVIVVRYKQIIHSLQIHIKCSLVIQLIKMNQHQEQTINRLVVSETYQIDSSQGSSDNESFGDLQDNANLENQQTQTIVIDEDTMESNDLLTSQSNTHPPILEEKEQSLTESRAEMHSQVHTQPLVGTEKESFYQGLINKLKQHSYNEQSLQESYAQFEANEKKYLSKIKIIYSHFIIKDKELTPAQFNHLRTLLFVPKYGENLVKWGNKKYGCTFTLPLALQRLDYMQKLACQPVAKRRCKDQLRVLGMLLLVVLLIKLLS